MNKLAVMQGRLLPKYKGRYQAFPADRWKDEFKLAKELEFDCIEFIYDHLSYNQNPLTTSKGAKELRSLVASSGIEVKTVCADYFMEARLHGVSESERQENISVLKNLIKNSSAINAGYIIIPCVDQSSLRKNKENIKQFAGSIREVIPIAEQYNINLSIEADLPPLDFKNMIESIKSDYVSINYDTGDSRYLGYDPVEEIETYGKYISTIHIKDRSYQKPSILLGKGAADFDQIFGLFSDKGFRGVITMQPYRDEEGYELFCQQYDWIKPRLTKYFGFQFKESRNGIEI